MKQALLIFVLLTATQAQAATRSFFTPLDEGQRIGACLADGTSCGKIAADAFCKKQGYAESILFARESVASARLIDNGTMCEGAACEAFKRIKCYVPIEAAANQS